MIILLIKVIKFLNAHEKKEYKQIAINPSWLSTRKTDVICDRVNLLVYHRFSGSNMVLFWAGNLICYSYCII